MELAFSIPEKMKFHDGVTKKILRELFKDKLPSSVIDNHRKIGFMTPFDKWLGEETSVRFVNEILNSSSFNNKNIWNAEKIRKIFNSKEKYPSFPYWRILNLELWSQVYRIKNL